MAHVSRREHPVQLLLACAVGVSVEAHRAPDEHSGGRALRHGPVLSSRIAMRLARTGRPVDAALRRNRRGRRSWQSPPQSIRRRCRGRGRIGSGPRTRAVRRAPIHWTRSPSAGTCHRRSPPADRVPGSLKHHRHDDQYLGTETRRRSSVLSGSKTRVRIVVEDRTRPRTRFVNPHPWKSGAATTCVSRTWNGIRLTIPATPVVAPAPARAAPRGRPVVPEVRMIMRLSFSGGGTVLGGGRVGERSSPRYTMCDYRPPRRRRNRGRAG
jgi:hypothetical protein